MITQTQRTGIIQYMPKWQFLSEAYIMVDSPVSALDYWPRCGTIPVVTQSCWSVLQAS